MSGFDRWVSERSVAPRPDAAPVWALDGRPRRRPPGYASGRRRRPRTIPCSAGGTLPSDAACDRQDEALWRSSPGSSGASAAALQGAMRHGPRNRCDADQGGDLRALTDGLRPRVGRDSLARRGRPSGMVAPRVAAASPGVGRTVRSSPAAAPMGRVVLAGGLPVLVGGSFLVAGAGVSGAPSRETDEECDNRGQTTKPLGG